MSGCVGSSLITNEIDSIDWPNESSWKWLGQPAGHEPKNFTRIKWNSFTARGPNPYFAENVVRLKLTKNSFRWNYVMEITYEFISWMCASNRGNMQAILERSAGTHEQHRVTRFLLWKVIGCVMHVTDELILTEDWPGQSLNQPMQRRRTWLWSNLNMNTPKFQCGHSIEKFRCRKCLVAF